MSFAGNMTLDYILTSEIQIGNLLFADYYDYCTFFITETQVTYILSYADCNCHQKYCLVTVWSLEGPQQTKIRF